MARFDVDALIEEIVGEGLGFTTDIGQLTWLSSGIDADDLSFTVDATGTQVSRGIVEIGNELVFVSSINQDTGTATVAPFGRGFQATTAQVWPANTRVTMKPRFPRQRVLDAINDLLKVTYPFIYAVGTTTVTTAGGGRISYELPADAEGVLRVEVVQHLPTRDWETVDRWHFNRSADATEFSTGKSIDIYEFQLPGRDMQVVYFKRPTALASGDTFTDCGLRESAWPAIKYGAMHMLLTGSVAGQAGTANVNAAEKNRQHKLDPAGVQREYYTLHRQYLLDERDRLILDYPPTNPLEF